MRDSWRVVVQDGLEASTMTYCNESVTLNTATLFFHFFPESTIVIQLVIFSKFSTRLASTFPQLGSELLTLLGGTTHNGGEIPPMEMEVCRIYIYIYNCIYAYMYENRPLKKTHHQQKGLNKRLIMHKT